MLWTMRTQCLMAVDGVLYSKDMSILYATPALGKGDFYVPETVSRNRGGMRLGSSEEQSRVLILQTLHISSTMHLMILWARCSTTVRTATA